MRKLPAIIDFLDKEGQPFDSKQLHFLAEEKNVTDGLKEHHARQKSYYDQKSHDYLSARPNDPYACNLINHVMAAAEIGPARKILELGAGEGRFSLPLLSAGHDVTCVDISEKRMARFFKNARESNLKIDGSRFHCESIEEFLERETDGVFDVVLGFFILHHLKTEFLPDILSRIRRVLKPGGKIGFVEPNRWNVLYVFQITFVPDFEWKTEIGMYRLSPGYFHRTLNQVGYENINTEYFGFFPPQIINRAPFLLPLEATLERVPIVNRFLPFLLVSAETGKPGAT
jgi:SAM-dependent methyltransferase